MNSWYYVESTGSVNVILSPSTCHHNQLYRTYTTSFKCCRALEFYLSKCRVFDVREEIKEHRKYSTCSDHLCSIMVAFTAYIRTYVHKINVCKHILMTNILFLLFEVPVATSSYGLAVLLSRRLVSQQFELVHSSG